MHPAHADYFVTLKRRLESAPHGNCGAIVREAASLMQRKPATIYRRLEAVGWQSGRKTRKDCGTLCVTEDLALLAAGMIKAATRANGKRTMPLTTAVGILEDNGMGVLVDQDTGEVTMPHPATMSRAMKVYGCHPDQVAQGSPAQELRSLHPNHVLEMDASTCVLFYLPAGKIAVMDERKYNERKPRNLEKLRNERVIRWVITDHYSGSIYSEYTTGAEDAATAIDVLIRAMCKRNDADLMYGAPLILFTDPGAANVSALMAAFCQRLKIRNIAHAPGAARATGQVENAQNIIETQFEGRLRFLDIQNLEQLNTHLTAWRIAWNANAIHSRHKHTRNQMWLTITPEQLRVPASVEALRALVASPPEMRKVSPKLILNYAPKGYGALTYSLRHIDGITVGGYVGVSVNPYEAPAVDVIIKERGGLERVYTLQPIERDAAGFAIDAPVIGEGYKSLPDTATDKAVKRMEREAYGVDTQEAATKAARKKTRVYADINAMADVEQAKTHTYLPRHGQGLDLAPTPAREIPPMSHVDAVYALRPLLAPMGIAWDADCMQWLKGQYPQAVPADNLEAVAAALTAHLRPQGDESDTDADQPVTSGTAPMLRLAVGGA